MKKFLLVLAIGAFVACNDSTSADETATDTVPAALPVDTAVVAPVDTAAAAVIADSAAAKVVDTLKK